MMSKIEDFVTRNGMSESVKREMLEILNESLLEISRGIMNESKVNKVNKVNKEKVEKGDKDSIDESKKRYKSKKAEEYAEEHGISIEDFEMNEISKKDVETKVREMTKNKVIRTTSKTTSDEGTSSKNNKSETKREKVICSGINKKGEACKSVGTIQPEGAKKRYCFRHAEDFRSFECDTDSSDDDDEKECTPCEINSEKKFSKENSDDELLEEEYN